MSIYQPQTFNYLLHPYTTSLVTCIDTDGNANIITIAWLVPLSFDPPLLGLSIRKSRFSYESIRTTGEFIINVAPYEIVEQVLFCGRNSGRDVDKFKITGLTAGKSQHLSTPIIQECLAHIECNVVNEVEVGDHQFIVAEVLAAYSRPDILTSDGLYDLSRVSLLMHLGHNLFTNPNPSTIEPTLI